MRQTIRVGAGLALAACSFQVAPKHPRPPLPTAATVEVAAPRLVERRDHGGGRITGVLMADDEQVRFELRRRTAGAAPGPLVVLVPILAGGEQLMGLIADRLVAQDFDVAFCGRAGSALSVPQRAGELNELFRRTVLHQRLLLAWLRAGDDAPPATYLLGLSMGGMVSTVVAAEEPRLDGVAICLSGADLASLIMVSSEGRVRRWCDWRQEVDGCGQDSLHWELDQFLDYEPFRFAPAIATDKVLFVSAAFDTVVPRRNQNLLWESLGRPQRIDLPFGHYSAALALDLVIRAAAEHFRACRHGPRQGG